MKIDTLHYDKEHWNLITSNIGDKSEAAIVFLFGDSNILKSEQSFNYIKEKYSHAQIVGASSSGNILGTEISNSPIVATAVQFEKGSVAISKVDFSDDDDVEQLSKVLIDQLPKDKLKHVFVMSDGLNINGSELVRGINKASHKFTVTGGMAGDGDRFQETWIVSDEPARKYRIVAVGFYGDDFSITTGCQAGWNSFGADRTVTKSSGNVLYELDNRPALDLYKEYLGEFAKDLPHSGMRFPLNIKEHEDAGEVIRTLLGIDEKSKSITFAGDIPEGYIVRLMKPDFDVLINGAGAAAEDINIINSNPALGLVVSCVGRRVVMKQVVEEELEAVEDVLGKNVQLTGFYSYGEIAPLQNDLSQCQLHNQTMTLTVIYEK
ncbi:MAG: FIST C-terminal domain-containing protein [Gammaproteobacteria bacterium]|nr:FIST C-terminal domain-containing protein [Gammaproteobacteria bacterium]